MNFWKLKNKNGLFRFLFAAVSSKALTIVDTTLNQDKKMI